MARKSCARKHVVAASRPLVTRRLVALVSTAMQRNQNSSVCEFSDCVLREGAVILMSRCIEADTQVRSV
jgi:hypothetical protein